MRGSVVLNRLVRNNLLALTPGGTGLPSASTGSTTCKSSLRCIPLPWPQDHADSTLTTCPEIDYFRMPLFMYGLKSIWEEWLTTGAYPLGGYMQPTSLRLEHQPIKH